MWRLIEMDKKNGKFVAYSDKTKSALIDLGEGEAWHKVQENAQQYFNKIEKNSECAFGFDGEELVYVKQQSQGQGQGQSQPKSQNQRNQDDSNKYNMQMSRLKNGINARTSALENATKIAIADENLDTHSKMLNAIQTMRDEFLSFIEGDTPSEGENPSP